MKKIAGTVVAAIASLVPAAFAADANYPNKSPDIVAQLNVEIMRIIKLPEVQARLVTEGAKSRLNTPAEFGTFVRAEIVKWGKVIRDSGARVD